MPKPVIALDYEHWRLSFFLLLLANVDSYGGSLTSSTLSTDTVILVLYNYLLFMADLKSSGIKSFVAGMGQYQIFVQYQYQYFLKFGSQNQYQYQNSSKSFFNIKINIKIKIFQNSISKSISKFLKVENQYQNQHQYSQNIDIDIENQKILGFKSLLLTPL